MQLATNFVNEFRKRLEESKTDRLLIRLINEHLQAFGPGKIGPNLLINRFLPKEKSILHRFDSINKTEV
jgi:hypothetical protein